MTSGCRRLGEAMGRRGVASVAGGRWAGASGATWGRSGDSRGGEEGVT
jgi:hypothetical protein